VFSFARTPLRAPIPIPDRKSRTPEDDVLRFPSSGLLLLLSATDDRRSSSMTTPQRRHVSRTTTSACMRTIRCVARCGPPPAWVEAHADTLNVEVDAAGADVSAPPIRCAGKGVKHAAASTAAAAAHLSSSLMALPPRIPPDAPPGPESERHDAARPCSWRAAKAEGSLGDEIHVVVL
jgi:hypothetical protein